ncbi:4'-phosphopantetheinyl transferase superfamily protein [Curtobacterium sp. BH-2-1-1]|jgi:4'-phosphopantetheinyl transferase|uniref:4'-phosphopantetheinyl transferase family protein n=1 Tax=Curtobacterium sp. BH-2-1-1 TaxID=1905847 RepID=UPI0011A73853|nr:4'-phosphopantetheinyl transferase superfamily protein [Curtobacterium sp. BH-2-1-1]
MSLSHSAGLAVLAIAPSSAKIGLDVETVDSFDRINRIASLAFSPRERREDGDAADSVAARLAQTRRWCRKEAILKAARVGVATPMRGLEIFDAQSRPARLSWPAAPAELPVARIQLFDLEPDFVGKDHIGAVACVGTDSYELEYVD